MRPRQVVMIMNKIAILDVMTILFGKPGIIALLQVQLKIHIQK